MDGRSIIENELPLHSLPSRPRGRLDHGSQAIGKKSPPLAQVDDVEDNALITLRILHREMEPQPNTAKLLVFREVA